MQWRTDVGGDVTALHVDLAAQRFAVGFGSGVCALVDRRLRSEAPLLLATRDANANDGVDSHAVLALGVPLLRPHALVAPHADGSVRVWDVRR